MSRFKKKGKKETPAINTASLPDIIFMLLFFFMVTTVMRETDLLVKVASPSAKEVQKLEKKSLVSFIYVGEPVQSNLGIWLAAALFSLMHFQFFGFVPRMILGALFGYYYYWSRNLWIPIIAHILNNGIIVVYTFFRGTTEMMPKLGEESTTESPSGLLIILSLSLSIAGLTFFYREGLKQKEIV